MLRRRERRGFTIIEVIIVVAIIGLLAAIAGIAFTMFKEQADDQRRASAMTVISEKLEQYYKDNGSYPTCAQMTASASTVEALLDIDEGILKAPFSQEENSFVCTAITTTSANEEYGYICTGGATCVGYDLQYRSQELGAVQTINSRYDTTAITNGLIAWWRLNGDLTDSSGAGHTGTSTGPAATTGQNGQANTAYNFTGTGYISTVGTISFSPTSFTTTVWMRAPSAADRKLLMVGTSNTHLPKMWTGGFQRVCMQDGGAALCNTGTKVLSDGYWHYIAIVGDATGVKAYVDGSSTPDVTLTVPGSAVSGLAYIGADSAGATRYIGDMDDLRIYDRALSVTETQVLYTLGAQ